MYEIFLFDRDKINFNKFTLFTEDYFLIVSWKISTLCKELILNQINYIFQKYV